MIFHFQQAIRALILLAFTVLIFNLHNTDEITKFINPKYVSLSQSASVIFLILFFIQMTRIWTNSEKHHDHCHHSHAEHSCEHHHDHGDSPFTLKKLFSYLVIVFPLITGFLLPAKVLDAAIADKKGGMEIITNQKQVTNTVISNFDNTNQEVKNPLNNNSVNEKEQTSVTHEIADIKLIEENTIAKEEYEHLIQNLSQKSSIIMDDTMFSSYYDEIIKDIKKFKGKKIELRGFVYKEKGLTQDQLVISRFLISHCVADASMIGFLSEITEASKIEEDTWIEVKGVLDITTYNGTELPVIKITNWKKINVPAEPYLYPINIKVL